MADPRKISRLRRGLARGAVWLAIITSICYVTLFEPNYRAHTVCDGATWTRVVVDPPLSGVKKPILIGSNAGHLFVISSGECETRRKRRRGAEDRGWMSFASDWFDRTWGYVSGHWNSLWPNDEPESPPGSNDEPEPPTGWFDSAWGYVSDGWDSLTGWFDSAWGYVSNRWNSLWPNDEPESPPGSNDEPEPPTGWFDSAWGYVSDRWNYLSNGRAEPPRAVVVPLSRVLCMYEYEVEVDAGNRPSAPCKARPEDPSDEPATEEQLARIEERLAGLLNRAEALDPSALTEIRDRLRLPALDPATTEQLARIEEHLAGLLARAEALPPPSGRATLLPVHFLLHFRNAQLSDPNGALSGSGVVLEPLHEGMLGAIVNTLRECAEQGSPVRIRPYGFASSMPFAGRDDTDDLNVMAANQRASAVYEALRGRLSGDRHVSVEEPPKWDTFEKMVEVRDSCIESPSREMDRDSFLDRVVVLELQTSGRCAMADWAARSVRCSDVADP